MQLMRHWGFAVVAAVTMTAAGAAQAAVVGNPLGLTERLPLIQADFMAVDYEPSTDQLTLTGGFFTGAALTLTTRDNTFNNTALPAGGTFDLMATILDDGTFVSGELRVRGDIGNGLETLIYTTDFRDFGWSTDENGFGDLLEFEFRQESDPSFAMTAHPEFAIGDAGGMFISFETSFDANNALPFGASFADDGTGFDGTFAKAWLPVPSAAWAGLALLGGIGSTRLIRRKRDA